MHSFSSHFILNQISKNVDLGQLLSRRPDLFYNPCHQLACLSCSCSCSCSCLSASACLHLVEVPSVFYIPPWRLADPWQLWRRLVVPCPGASRAHAALRPPRVRPASHPRVRRVPRDALCARARTGPSRCKASARGRGHMRRLRGRDLGGGAVGRALLGSARARGDRPRLAPCGARQRAAPDRPARRGRRMAAAAASSGAPTRRPIMATDHGDRSWRTA